MLKKNKALLKKIYEEEYLKAAEKAKKDQLSREIARIKKKAQEDAKRKYNMSKTGSRNFGKLVKKASSGVYKKRAKRIQKASDDLGKRLMGW